MEKRGVRFKIPNKQGQLILELLEPINGINYNWNIKWDEIHIVENGEFNGEMLFKDNKYIIAGNEFYNAISNNTYYLVFAHFEAFPKNTLVTNIDSYNDFLNSECEMVMLVADCSATYLFLKDERLIEKLYFNAKNKGYKDVEYMNYSYCNSIVW